MYKYHFHTHMAVDGSTRPTPYLDWILLLDLCCHLLPALIVTPMADRSRQVRLMLGRLLLKFRW